MAKIYFSFEADSVEEFNKMVSSLAMTQSVVTQMRDAKTMSGCCSEKVGATEERCGAAIIPANQTVVDTEVLATTTYADFDFSKQGYNPVPVANISPAPILTQQEVNEAERAEEEVKQRRKRRTKAEIEADRLREAEEAKTGLKQSVETVPADARHIETVPVEGEVIQQSDWVQQEEAQVVSQVVAEPPIQPMNFNLGNFAPPAPSTQPTFNLGQNINLLNTVAQNQPQGLPADLLSALGGFIPKQG